MPTLHRLSNPDRIVLTGLGYSVTVTLEVRGLEVDATTVERALHAAVAQVAHLGGPPLLGQPPKERLHADAENADNLLEIGQ